MPVYKPSNNTISLSFKVSRIDCRTLLTGKKVSYSTWLMIVCESSGVQKYYILNPSIGGIKLHIGQCN